MGTPLPSSKTGQSPSIFGPCLLWPNGWMDQDATWYDSRPRPMPHCVTWGASSPSKKGTAPNFGPMSIVAKRSPISATAEHLYRLLLQVVHYPLRSRITKSRSTVVIAVIWLASSMLSSVQLIIGESNPRTLPGGRQVGLVNAPVLT